MCIALGDGWYQCDDVISKTTGDSVTVLNLARLRLEWAYKTLELAKKYFPFEPPTTLEEKRLFIEELNQQPRNWFGIGLRDMIEMQNQLNESIDLHFKHMKDSSGRNKSFGPTEPGPGDLPE